MNEWNGLFGIQSESEFEEWALKVFAFQVENNVVYRQFCQLMKQTSPKSIHEIPFLPISFFKTHEVRSENFPIQTVFKSSGTTGMVRSQHFVQSLDMYRESFRKTYLDQIGDPKDQVILALLPNYVEQGESSLVFMVDDLIRQTNNVLSGFLLSDMESCADRYQKAVNTGKKVVLFGVSYALLDLAEKGMNLSQSIIIETGGMKGKREEMSKEKMHDVLMKGFQVDHISSEYGMTELLSQAYSKKNGLFTLPPWMTIFLRETSDPLTELSKEKTGGINVIDLANVYSCSFIATQDLGRIENGQLRLMGRFDNADIRGCNLLVE
jgi:phenylacetate-coenzyme A ligase PaaK-like adenylate-forming protein